MIFPNLHMYKPKCGVISVYEQEYGDLHIHYVRPPLSVVAYATRIDVLDYHGNIVGNLGKATAAFMEGMTVDIVMGEPFLTISTACM